MGSIILVDLARPSHSTQETPAPTTYGKTQCEGLYYLRCFSRTPMLMIAHISTHGSLPRTDLRVPVLPYLNQDRWSCDKTPKDVPAIIIDNEYIRAAITPQVRLECVGVICASCCSHLSLFIEATLINQLSKLIPNWPLFLPPLFSIIYCIVWW